MEESLRDSVHSETLLLLDRKIRTLHPKGQFQLRLSSWSSGLSPLVCVLCHAQLVEPLYCHRIFVLGNVTVKGFLVSVDFLLPFPLYS